MTQAETPQPQSLAGGRYLLVEPIGEGGMATVWRGFDQRLQVWRAVKVLNPKYSKSRKIKARFDAEAQTMALLEHPNIVRVYDVGSVGDISYIVMELVEGGTLVDWLENWGSMPPGLALHATEMLCAGISAAHSKGVIHRDIKPHNVLVTLDGTCRVTDFGIARVGDTDQSLTKTGAVMGTWGYMAPEQRSDAKGVDERADVYAIAATLYTLVTNRIPMDLFAADRDKSVMAGVPEPLYEVLLKATDYDRERRYPSVGALRDALAEVAQTLPPDPAGTHPLASRRPDRRAPPPPELIARAVPLVPEGGAAPVAPTLLPTSQGTDPGGTPVSAPRADITVAAEDYDAAPDDEEQGGASPMLWGVVGVVFLAGLALFGVAGLVVVAGVLQPDADPVEDVPVVVTPPDDDDGQADALADTDADTDAVEATPEPPPSTPAVPPTRPDPTPPQGQADPAPEPEPPAADTDVAPAVAEPVDPGPGTADDTDAVAASPSVTVVPTVDECVQVTPVGRLTVGSEAAFEARLCSEATGKDVTLWYRPAGTAAWQSVGMAFRLGAYRTKVPIDDRFGGGFEYYIETDGATWGSRGSPKRVAVR